jgi:hypothetical protein
LGGYEIIVTDNLCYITFIMREHTDSAYWKGSRETWFCSVEIGGIIHSGDERRKK